MSRILIPKTDANKLIAFQSHVNKLKVSRDLEGEDDRIPVIPTECGPLDYVFGCGGLPRGKIIEIYGPESSGKCVEEGTYINVPGEGILTMGELVRKGQWQEEPIPNGVASLHKPVCTLSPSADGQTEAVHAYYAGSQPTITLYTENGHNLRGTATHRVLTLPSNGIARWTTLANLRPSDILVGMAGMRISGQNRVLFHAGPDDPQFPDIISWEGAALLGAVSTAEQRHDGHWLSTASVVQRRAVREWSRKTGLELVMEPTSPWTRFTGLAKLTLVGLDLLKIATSPSFLKNIRTAPLDLQEAWLAGITLTKGQWTQNDLEVEIPDSEVARTAHAVSDNLGVRWARFTTLDTFGDPRTKLTLRSRADQQTAEETIWKNGQLPTTWQRHYSREEDETHHHAQATLSLACNLLEKAGKEFKDIDSEDTSKENLQDVFSRCAPHARNQTQSRVVETLSTLAHPHTSLDRSVGTETSPPASCWDVHVPIGHHYAANGLVSHNSTLAMYFCKKELEVNPEGLCAYLDYERSTAKAYARKMGLLAFGKRFQLLTPDSLEQADQLFKDLFKIGVFPSIIVTDSVAAMTPEDMFTQDMTETAPLALKARKMSLLMDTWSKIAGDYGVTFLMLNQTRTHIDTSQGRIKRLSIPGLAEHAKEDTTGGVALKFFASVRLRISVKKVMTSTIFNPMTGENEEIPCANVVKLFAIKNKVAAPYRSGQFYITFGEGVDPIRSMLEIADVRKILTTGGAGNRSIILTSGRVIKAQGEENFVKLLRTDKPAQVELMKMLEWDKVEEITSRVIGTSSVSLDGTVTTDDAQSAAERAAANGLTKAMIDQAPTLAHRAHLLGLIKQPSSNRYTYQGEKGELAARNLESLNGKLTKVDQKTITEAVTERLAMLEEMIAAQKATPEDLAVAPDLTADTGPGPLNLEETSETPAEEDDKPSEG